jgi:Ca-activated chloride channel family protein
MIDFAETRYLLLLVVVGGLGFGFVRLMRWRRRALTSFAGPQAARWRPSTGWPQAVLVLTAATLLVLAAARPHWDSREFSRERQGVDLVIVLDVSQSMLARDAEPSRLGRAQDELVALVESLRGSRIGLVLFAGTAVLRSPLTTDTQAMTELIRRADREAGLARVGSDIAAALDQAGRILEASESPGKAIVVVSDGEDHVDAFAGKARELTTKGILVFAAGIGTAEGSTIVETTSLSGQARVKLDAQGRPVITRLDEATLQALATEGGGRYLHLDGESRLLSLRDDLAELEQTPLAVDTQRVPIERYQLFAGAAFVLLALAWLLPERVALPRFARPRLSPALGAVLAAVLAGACGGADSLRDKNAAANDLFAAGDFQAALEAYDTLLAERPDVSELAFNAGNTLHRLGEFERAIAETRRALPPTTTDLGADTLYSLGNHLYALDRLEEAYEAYRNALLLDPADADAKHNLELTLLRLQNQQPEDQQQPGGPPQPGEGTPPPGEEGQPQPGQPTGTPQSAPPGTPTPGTATNPLRDLQEALAGLDEELSFEEAIRILDLLREQQERQRPSNPSGAPTGPDY